VVSTFNIVPFHLEKKAESICQMYVFSAFFWGWIEHGTMAQGLVAQFS
jgi:hypothetical protein